MSHRLEGSQQMWVSEDAFKLGEASASSDSHRLTRTMSQLFPNDTLITHIPTEKDTPIEKPAKKKHWYSWLSCFKA